MTVHAATAEARAVGTRARRPAAAPSPLFALALAGLCVLAMVAVWSVAELVPAVHLKDAVALAKFTALSRPSVDSLTEFVLHLLDPLAFVLWGVALVATALARERPRVALVVAVVLTFAPVSADVLKPLLAHAHDHVAGAKTIGAASWPSGHATAATALAMCAVLVAPRRLRGPVALLGAVFVLAVAVSLLVLAWHMPSDVLGGVLLATLWMALAVAALRAAERVRPSRRPG
jgi:membrane-associated phospholipid phosphatase